MEAFVEIFKYTLPLVGVGVGWLLTQYGEKLKVAREDKRRIKKAIFYLLEVRHQLSFFTGNEHGIKRYISILRKKYSFLIPKEVTDELLAQIFSQVMKQVVKDKPLITDDDLKNLSINYAKSVDSLSEIDPIIAFRLQGRHNIQEVLKDLVNRMKTSMSGMVQTEKDKTDLESAFEKIAPNLIETMLDDLDNIILQLAKKVDKATYKAAQGRMNMSISKEHVANIEKFAEKIVKDMLSDAEKQKMQ